MLHSRGRFGESSKRDAGSIRKNCDFRAEVLSHINHRPAAITEWSCLPLAYIWALDPRMIPIPGFKTVEQVQQNAGAMEFGPLSEDELQKVQEIVAERQPTGSD